MPNSFSCAVAQTKFAHLRGRLRLGCLVNSLPCSRLTEATPLASRKLTVMPKPVRCIKNLTPRTARACDMNASLPLRLKSWWQQPEFSADRARSKLRARLSNRHPIHSCPLRLTTRVTTPKYTTRPLAVDNQALT